MPTLPISFALREAAPESITELFSRPVEGMEDTDIDRVILECRSNRARMEAAELAATKAPKARKTKDYDPIDLKDLDI